MIDAILRKASADDSVDLWNWRNDPETRRNSVSSLAISWPDHSAWFERSLSNSRRIIFIIESSRVKHGMVRFDQSERDSGLWEVSIAINPEFRGRGFGVIALRMACAEILADGKAHVLNAKVRHENHPSLRLFERCGFNEESRDNEFVFLRRTDFENISNQETARR